MGRGSSWSLQCFRHFTAGIAMPYWYNVSVCVALVRPWQVQQTQHRVPVRQAVSRLVVVPQSDLIDICQYLCLKDLLC